MNIATTAATFPELKSTCNNEDPEVAVTHVLTNYARLAQKHNNDMMDISGLISRTADQYPAFEKAPVDDVKAAVVHIIDIYKDLFEVYYNLELRSTCIPKMILDASKEYPALQAANLDDPYGAVQHLLKTYQSLVHLYLKAADDLKTAKILAVKISSLEQELKDAGSKLATMGKTIEDLGQKNRKQAVVSESQNKKYQVELSHLKDNLKREREENKAKHESLIAEHKVELRHLQLSLEAKSKKSSVHQQDAHASF